MSKNDWDGKEDRRQIIRREVDKQVCPFHKIKCDAIQANKNSIHEIEGKMATKEDLYKLEGKIDNSAPRWVLTLLALLTAGTIAWMVTRMETRFDSIYVMKANQEILLKAFHIEPIKTVKEAEEELNGN